MGQDIGRHTSTGTHTTPEHTYDKRHRASNTRSGIGIVWHTPHGYPSPGLVHKDRWGLQKHLPTVGGVFMSDAGCGHCGGVLPPLRSRGQARKWCSESCRLAAYWLRQKSPASLTKVWFRQCRNCSVLFTAKLGQVHMCSPECQTEHTKKLRPFAPSYGRSIQTRRARKRAVESEPIDRIVVAERDGWNCGICDEDIDRDRVHPDPRSLSMDHVVALAFGGPHTYANIRATHLECNIRRGAEAVA